MNYLAHGRHALAEPILLAGTAVPDWLAACDRPARVRARAAEPFLRHEDPRLAELARGIMRHHAEDDWFHRTRAFAELSMGFSVRLRGLLGADQGHRTSFLGHVLVELLLDAELEARAPGLVDRYYAALEQVDPAWITAAVEQMAPRPPTRLRAMIDLFHRERFLYDYADDAKLFVRLNHLMRRVGLPPLPETVVELFPPARREVASRAGELLAAPGTAE